MNSESKDQALLVQWFRRTYEGVRIFAIPNGGARSASQAARLKAEGVSRGVPDLFVPAWRCWIEMKREKGGRVDSDQEDWHQHLREIGDTVIIARGFDDAVRQVKEFIGE